MKITIVGAGMAGLLAGNMLRRHKPKILEKQSELPDNHLAVLRFRSTAVGDATGVPFRRVRIRKGIYDGCHVQNDCTLRMANIYSAKVSDAIAERSCWNLAPEERYLAPVGFLEMISRSLDVSFNARLDLSNGVEGDAVISTIPLPALMQMCGMPITEKTFRHKPIWVYKAVITQPEVHIFQTVYNADPVSAWYRATLHGQEFIVEFSVDPQMRFPDSSLSALLWEVFGVRATILPGMVVKKEQKFGKILPAPEELRRNAILHFTNKLKIYSLGRFATWRPGLLLDDLVKDVKLIEAMIEGHINRYDRHLQYLQSR
jgi:hypothetical protein